MIDITKVVENTRSLEAVQKLGAAQGLRSYFKTKIFHPIINYKNIGAVLENSKFVNRYPLMWFMLKAHAVF